MDDYLYFAEQDFARGSYTWRIKTEERLNSVAISSDGNYVAAASDDGYIYFCE